MQKIDTSQLNLEDRVIFINRNAKVVKGGRRFSFSALVATGDKQGHVGVGLGKAPEVADAIRKGIEKARKNIIEVPLKEGRTIPFEVFEKFCATKVFMKPASSGTGVIAGSAVRIILELVGVKDVLTKIYGSKNPLNIAYCTMKNLKEIIRQEEVSKIRKELV